MTAVGREFPEAKKERKRQNIAKIQVPKGNWNSNPKNMICKERLVEKKLSVCIEVIRRKEANVTKKDGKEG